MAVNKHRRRRSQSDPARGKSKQSKKQAPSRNNRNRKRKQSAPVLTGPDEQVAGVLELASGNGNGGHLRDPKRHLVARQNDPEVPREVIRHLNLRGGELLSGAARIDSRRGPDARILTRIEEIDGAPAAEWRPPELLADATAIDPDVRLCFDTKGGPLSMRVVELFTPIGLGQRGLIVAPPRSGKTILLQQLAHGLAENHPDVYMIVLLIDERPEEVTEMRRNVRGEVFASSNDHTVESHIRVARLVIERARRLVESGQDVVLLLDSITRLGRAFNNFVRSSGRTMTGGLDINALQEPKQIFGSARNVERGGSLTILATALVETGSRADEFIFQEFKGTGNMEMVLDRSLAEMRIWPAIDLQRSGTRKEEKLLEPETLAKVNRLRRWLLDMPANKQIPTLLEKMQSHETLESFLASVRS